METTLNGFVFPSVIRAVEEIRHNLGTAMRSVWREFRKEFPAVDRKEATCRWERAWVLFEAGWQDREHSGADTEQQIASWLVAKYGPLRSAAEGKASGAEVILSGYARTGGSPVAVIRVGDGSMAFIGRAGFKRDGTPRWLTEEIAEEQVQWWRDNITEGQRAS